MGGSLREDTALLTLTFGSGKLVLVLELELLDELLAEEFTETFEIRSFSLVSRVF